MAAHGAGGRGHYVDDVALPRWRRLGQALLDLIFPPRCVGCRRPGPWLCSDCLDRVGHLRPPLCERCGRPLSRPGLCPACRGQESTLAGVRAPFFFEGVVRRAVHELKYRGRRMLAEPLGALLAHDVRALSWPRCSIVPTPLHRQRERARGYNQAALLARALAGRLGWPLLENGLVRQRDTRSQVGLDGQARRHNVQGAFRWQGAEPAPAQVLLLDDVYTTGATMEACAQALREAGADEVRGLALARPR